MQQLNLKSHFVSSIWAVRGSELYEHDITILQKRYAILNFSDIWAAVLGRSRFRPRSVPPPPCSALRWRSTESWDQRSPIRFAQVDFRPAPLTCSDAHSSHAVKIIGAPDVSATCSTWYDYIFLKAD